MQNVVLLIHLLLTLALILVVLLQRSEGGGLGMGGGGATGSGRPAATAMGKVTWGLGLALFATSIALTIIAAQSSGSTSVLDRVIDAPVAPAESSDTVPGLGDNLLPPPSGDDAPLTPTLE